MPRDYVKTPNRAKRLGRLGVAPELGPAFALMDRLANVATSLPGALGLLGGGGEPASGGRGRGVAAPAAPEQAGGAGDEAGEGQQRPPAVGR